jgi:ABC-type nitrate/sulfonate/bicarbonate transport system substrate-binding protein
MCAERERIMRGLFAAAAAVATFAFAGAPAMAQQGAVEDVTIAVPNFTFTLTPIFVADELGLWAKHGLRLKMIQVAGVGATNAVIAGSADFAQAGGSTLTRANARGQHLIAIANTADRNIVVITLRKELAPDFDPNAPLAKRAQVLRGRTMGVGAIQANPHAYLRVVAARAGIDPESIRVTAMEGNSMLAALKAKTIDGMSNSPPFPLKPVVDGVSLIVASGADGDPPNALDFAYNVILTRPETCEKRKSVCMKVGQVYKDAVAYMHDHPKETEAVLQTKFPKLDAALIDLSYQQILKSTPKVPVVTRKQLENADDFNVEGGLLKASEKLKSYDGLFTDEFVK